PKAMKCIVAGPRAPNKPSQVSMVLHEGAGLPGVWAGRNKFEVSVDGVKTISKRSWFNTQRMHRSSGNRSYGEASISAFFVTKDRKNITLAVGGYDDLTNTMNGSLTFADPTVLSYPNHKSFKISCYVGKLPMGLDLDNSEPSRQRPVEPDPDFSVPGCDSILLATKTRAQQDHEVATMRGLILSDISNGAAILKYMKAENEMHNSVMNGWKKNRPGVLELIAAMKSVEQNPAVKLYLETRVVSERPRKCVKFEGE
ncbi:MAG: hypothetical protein V4692_12090, partial [Bdellovibrionota bacterium]